MPRSSRKQRTRRMLPPCTKLCGPAPVRTRSPMSAKAPPGEVAPSWTMRSASWSSSAMGCACCGPEEQPTSRLAPCSRATIGSAAKSRIEVDRFDAPRAPTIMGKVTVSYRLSRLSWSRLEPEARVMQQVSRPVRLRRDIYWPKSRASAAVAAGRVCPSAEIPQDVILGCGPGVTAGQRACQGSQRGPAQ